MNFVDSGFTRLKSVSDIANEAIIGPAVNRISPTSHGEMKISPQSASRTEGRSVNDRPGGDAVGSPSIGAGMGQGAPVMGGGSASRAGWDRPGRSLEEDWA